MPAIRLTLRRWFADPALKWPLGVYLGLRLGLSGLAVALWLLGLVPRTPDLVPPLYFEITPVMDGWPGLLLGVWQRFDVINYQRIAEYGYLSPEISVFFPLLPLAMRGVSAALGGNSLAAGLLIANVAAPAALIGLYRLAVREGCDLDSARRAVLYLAVFPTSFFLLVPYTESLFLFLALLTFWLARNGHWARAMAAAFLASLTRTSALALAPALLWELWEQYGWSPTKIGWRVGAALAPFAGFGVFMLWRAWQGYRSFAEYQYIVWQRTTDWPWMGIWLTLVRIANGQATLVEYIDLGCVGLFIGLGVVVLRRMPLSYGLYYWALLLFNLSPRHIPQALLSQTRYVLTLFPAFILLGRAGHSPLWGRAILYPFTALLFYLAGQFILWGWAG